MEQAAPGTTTASASLSYGPVERRSSLTAAEIIDYLRTSTPVVIEGGLAHCPALARWSTPQALAERVGDRLVPVTQLPSGTIRYYRDLPHDMRPFSECVRNIFGGDGVSYYVHQANLLAESPKLLEDLVFPYPELEQRLHFQEALFWIGSGDTVSRLHCDFPHNFIGQFKGSKRFRIFPQAQAPHFYTPPPYAPDPYHTPVSTMGDTSLEQYPLFAGARGLETVIEEGDFLVLPSLWWHQVIAQQPSVMINWFGLTPAMERDWPRLRDWAVALAGSDWELGMTLARRFEELSVRDAGIAATARLLCQQGQLALAQRAVSETSDASYADEMAIMFAGSAQADAAQ